MKNFINYIKENWILYFIILQPILDSVAYFQTKLFGNSFTWIIRIILLCVISLYIFIKSKNKTKLILTISPFIIYFLLHILNLNRVNSLNLVLDIKYFVLIFQMPILSILLIDYSKDNEEKINKIKKGMVGSLIVIAVIIFLSYITNSYEITYEYTKTGILGWFTGSNTPSMILCALCPWFIHYFSTEKNNYLYFTSCILAFALLYFNATKSCYITMIASFIVILFNSIISKNKIYKIKKIFIPLFFIILSLLLYPFSFTAINRNTAKENIKNNKTEIKKVTNNKNEISNSLSDEEILRMLKISHIYVELMEVQGEKNVVDAMRNNISAENLANNRLLKVINAKIENNNSDFITKCLGMGYSRFIKYDYDLETDLDAIYYYYGYFGFLLYIGFISYFILKLFIKFIKKPSIIFDGEYLFLFYLILLLVFGGQYSGAFLRKPNANIYMSLFLVLLYLRCIGSNKSDVKIYKNSNKITFLLLHLGYGGIETATINSANALSEKKEVEIISFYKLNNDQSAKLKKNISVKYLYKGAPNKNEFLRSFHDKNILNFIKESIKSLDILIKKKIMVIYQIIKSDSKYIISTRSEFSNLLSKYGDDECVKIVQEHHHHNNNKKYINSIKHNYSNIDYLCALTKTLKKDYEKILKNNNNNIKIIVLPNMLFEIPNIHSNLENKNIITICRLDKNKRVNELIDIYSKINNKNSKFFIIGDGEELEILKKQINKMKLETKVKLFGYKDKTEIEEFMLNSSVFVMASISEGLPMVLLEAMSYGIPCIAYETDSGVNDIIKNDRNGLIIKKRNENEFVERLNYLLKNKNIRKKFSENAIKTANKFSKEEILKIWYSIIK